MSQPAPTDPAPRLLQLAQLLRAAPHLGPEAQHALADLVDELNAALATGATSAAANAHLAESAAHLIEALHAQKDAGFLENARRHLQEAAVRAEADAPVATGVVRRLIDALANLGI